MRGQFLLFVSILYMLNLVCITSCRLLVPNDGAHAFHSGTETEQKQRTLSLKKNPSVGGEEKEEEIRRIGSSPPSCDHKCYGCMPCEAIQVPTTRSRVGVQYANYEPEGWKCKCGPTFYTP